MSRGSTPQKDTKPPCKVVVVGTKGQDPGAVRDVERRLAGTISRFYNASRQNSDASQGDVWHAHQALPDGQGQLSYSSNQGLEVMTIRLNPEKIEEFEETKEPEKKRETWDWLLIELEMEAIGTYDSTDGMGLPRLGEMTVAARFWKPPLEDIMDPESPDPENPVPLDGGSSLERFALDQQRYDISYQQEPTALFPPVDNPRLMFAGAVRAEQIAPPEVDSSETVTRSSLLVDIRANVFDDIIYIDLWGSVAFTTMEKSLVGVVTRTIYDSPPQHETILRRNGIAIQNYIEDNHPDLFEDISLFFSETSSGLNEWLPVPFTTSTVTDADLQNDANFNAAGKDIAWLNANRTSSRNMFEGTYITGWVHEDATPVWSSGEWWRGSWSDFAGAHAAYDPLIGTANYTGPAAPLGLQYITIEGEPFWQTSGPSAPSGLMAEGDPGTPPPDVGFQTRLGGSGPIDFTSFLFFRVFNTYLFRANFTALGFNQVGLIEAPAAIKAAAFKGNYLDPPEDEESTGDAQWMWSKQRLTATEAIYQSISPDSTSALDFGQWEIKGDYPSRPDLAVIDGAEAVTLTNETGFDEDGFDLPTTTAMIDNAIYLGRIAFDQKDASFAWTPAAEIDEADLPEMPPS